MVYNSKFDLCYPILEKDIDGIIRKIKSTISKKVNMYELRLDSLKGLLSDDIMSITDGINSIKKKFPHKKFIVTIRTKGEGGNVTLTSNKYIELIKYLLENAKADYIDIEYKYYEKNKGAFNRLIRKSRLKTILSKHLFHKNFSSKKCEEILKSLSKSPCDIVKLAVKIDDKNKVYEFMELSKRYNSKISKLGKRGIFIAMGREGIISRVFPQYAGTRVVFLDAYDKKRSKLYQPNLTFFLNFYNKILDYLKK